MRTKENSNVRSESKNARIILNSGSEGRTRNKPEFSRSQSAPKSAPNRSNERVDQSRRSSAPSMKQSGRTNESRSKNAVRSSSKNVRSSESKKAETKKESNERRR
jgi:hypothetical protein